MAAQSATNGFKLASRDGRGLLWSEYWYLLASVVAAVVVVDPLGWDLTADPVVRHLALAIALPPVVLTLAGRSINTPSWQQKGYLAQIVRVAWPLLTLAMLIIAGSLHARYVGQIQNTFLNVGTYMLMTVCAAALVLQSDAPELLLRNHLRILLLAAVVMGVGLIVNFGVREVYHEQIFLVIPMAVLFFAQTRRTLMRWLGCAFCLAMAGFSQKYTSYLIGLTTVIYLAVFLGLPRLRVRSRLGLATVVYWACLLAILAAVGLAYFAMQRPDHLPSGNLEYRLHTYGAAWDRFLDSPLWGTLFTAEAVEKFPLYAIKSAGNVLPSHSDVMDFLAHGGMVAVLLWAFGLAKIARIAWSNLLRTGVLDHPWAPYAHVLALMSLGAVITYAVNPILLQPSMAYLLWTNLGLLLGISLRAAATGTPSPQPVAQARVVNDRDLIPGDSRHVRA